MMNTPTSVGTGSEVTVKPDNGKFDGQREKEGRLMSVSEGVGTEVYFVPVVHRYLHTIAIRSL